MADGYALSTEGDDGVWQRILARDRTMDGRMVFAVRTTRIFCRPSCPARRPKRENVEFYPSAETAESAGYRPCRRCRPETGVANTDAALAQRAANRITNRGGRAITLQWLARELAVSPRHLHRVFKRETGVTPRAFLDHGRSNELRRILRGGASVRRAAARIGLPSPNEFYRSGPAHLGMTPGTFKRRGESVRIRFVAAPCSLGFVLVAATDRGICSVELGGDPNVLEGALRSDFSRAQVERDDKGLAAVLREVLLRIEGNAPSVSLSLDVRATAFQRRVWDALQKIPRGGTQSYGDVAARLGRPSASRAVAKACASNPAAVVVPCHRVVAKDESLRGYRWGVARKQRLQQNEREATAADPRRSQS